MKGTLHKLYKEIIGKPLVMWRKRDFDKHFERISSLDIELVGKCNLNCKSCTHFSPIAESERLSIQEFEKDMRQLAKIMPDKIGKINLLGGEPLLHEEVESFMEVSRKYFPGTEIYIVTNGILLLQQNESFWLTARENRIGIEVTKYPIRLDFKKMKEKALQYDVSFKFYGRSGYIQKSQYFLPIDVSGRQDKEESFKGCFMARECITLYHGRLFPCSYAAYMERFNRYFNKEIPIRKDDYADIYHDGVEDILRKISQPIPMCSHCNTKERTYGNKWGISKKEIKEWS